jgi:hypothetical protein
MTNLIVESGTLQLAVELFIFTGRPFFVFPLLL